MPSTTINAATNLTPLLATDVIPVERPNDTTPYHATAATVKTYILNTPLPMPAVTGDGTWRVHWDETTFNGHKDQIFFLSYNLNNFGVSQDDAAMPSMWMGYESDYWYDASNHISEWYVSWLKPAGATAIRALHITWDVATEQTDTYLRNDNVWFQDAAGSATHAKGTPTGWTFYQDVMFAANKGDILADRSDGHTYRIKVTNGTLGTEQVT